MIEYEPDWDQWVDPNPVRIQSGDMIEYEPDWDQPSREREKPSSGLVEGET